MSQNVLVVHGGGPTAVQSMLSLYGVESKKQNRNPEVWKKF